MAARLIEAGLRERRRAARWSPPLRGRPFHGRGACGLCAKYCSGSRACWLVGAPRRHAVRAVAGRAARLGWGVREAQTAVAVLSTGPCPVRDSRPAGSCDLAICHIEQLPRKTGREPTRGRDQALQRLMAIVVRSSPATSWVPAATAHVSACRARSHRLPSCSADVPPLPAPAGRRGEGAGHARGAHRPPARPRHVRARRVTATSPQGRFAAETIDGDTGPRRRRRRKAPPRGHLERLHRARPPGHARQVAAVLAHHR